MRRPGVEDVAASGAVLAGGASRRLGRDKREVRVDGVPLVRRVVMALAEVCGEVLVVTRPDRPVAGAALDGLDLRVVHDRRDDAGPLAGIEAALAAARHDVVIVLATDLPFVAPDVLRLLVERAGDDDVEAAVLVSSRGPEPLIAAYRRSALTTVTAALDAGERRVMALLDELACAAIGDDEWHRHDPTRRTPWNVNADDDLDLASSGPSALRRVAAPEAEQAGVRLMAVRGTEVVERADRLAGEEPLEVRVAGPGQQPVSVAVTLRTPGHEAELALGFLHSEGLIAPGDVCDVTFGDPGQLAHPDDVVTVHVGRRFDASLVPDRHFVATASCGICGKASLDAVAVRTDPLLPGPTVTRDVLEALPVSLREAQRVFASTGGLHAAGLFDPSGGLVAAREDVGRHNALDKLIGSQMLAGATPLHDRIVLVSGRVSFELVQKAAVAGVAVLCAVSAPSSLAVAAAERLGMTLVGFLRGDGFNCYTGRDRLRLA